MGSASDSYGVAASDSFDSFSQSASDSYGAAFDEPIINDNSLSFAASSLDTSYSSGAVSSSDSYGSPRSPAPSSYDAPAVPSLAGNSRNSRQGWGHQLL